MKSLRRMLFVAVCLLPATTCGCGAGNADLVDKWDRARLAGFNEFRNNQYDQAIAHYREAIAAAQGLGADDRRVALTTNELARVFLAKSDFQSAADSYKAALSVLSQLKPELSRDPELVAADCEALDGLGNSLNKLGQDAEAEHCYQEALARAKTDKLGQQLRTITFDYRSFLRQHGETARADALTEQTEADRTTVEPLPASEDDAKYQMESHLREGDEALRHNDLNRAEAEYKMALAAAERMKNRLPAGNCASRMGQVAFRREQWKQAMIWFDYAMKNYSESKAGLIARRSAVSGLAMTLCKLKNYEQAEFCAKQLIADSRWIRSKDGSEMREGLMELAEVYRQSGQLEKATAPLQEIYDNCRQYQPITCPDATLNMCYLSTHYWSLNKKDECRKIVDEYLAVALKSKPDTLQLPGRLLDDYAEALIKSKQFDCAAVYLPAARRLLEKASNAQKERLRCQTLMGEVKNAGG